MERRTATTSHGIFSLILDIVCQAFPKARKKGFSRISDWNFTINFEEWKLMQTQRFWWSVDMSSLIQRLVVTSRCDMPSQFYWLICVLQSRRYINPDTTCEVFFFSFFEKVGGLNIIILPRKNCLSDNWYLVNVKIQYKNEINPHSTPHINIQ